MYFDYHVCTHLSSESQTVGPAFPAPDTTPQSSENALNSEPIILVSIKRANGNLENDDLNLLRRLEQTTGITTINVAGENDESIVSLLSQNTDSFYVDGSEDLEKQYGLVEKSKKQPQKEPSKKLEKNPGPGPQFLQPDSEISVQNYDDNVEKIMEKKKRKRKTNNKDEKTLADNVKIPGDYDNSDPKYATWLPPTNQSGDGKTALNDKYGY